MHESTMIGKLSYLHLQKGVRNQTSFKLPPQLKKQIIKLRLTLNLEVGKFAEIITPTLRATAQGSQANHINFSYSNSSDTMNFVIKNFRGCQSPDFRRNFHNMLNYYKPTLVILVETHLTNHAPLRDDFELLIWFKQMLKRTLEIW